MSKNKRLLVRLLITVMLLSTSILVYASNNSKSNIHDFTVREVNDIFYNITEGILDGNVSYTYGNIFESDVFDELNSYGLEAKIGGDISNIVVDFVDVPYSSTGDIVIMVNTKVDYENGKYNKLYLFEYHINANGKIYGYNVWVY